MMLRNWTLIACALLLALTCCYAEGGKVLLGTSFEEDKPGGVPDGWTKNAKEPNRLELVTTEAHTGKQSLHLLDQSTTLDCNLRSPQYPATPGQYYQVVWWFKAAPKNVGSLYVEFWNKDGKRIEGDGVRSIGCQATGAWERHAAVVIAPDGAVGVTLLPSCWSQGTTDAYYDDLKLTEGEVSLIERKTMPPATVVHPCGLYRAADLERAKENLQRHQWARDLLASYRSAAKFWMDLPDAEIPFWIGEDTPMRVMDCPKCGANWDYAWKFLPPDKLQCTRCGLTLPNPDYPETGTETYLNPVGKRVTLQYYKGENGRKYRISAVLRYFRVCRLDSLGALGKVYALTGERAYAEKAVKVLRRLAEVYPGYLAHDWDHVYPDYSNLQSGKLSGWKLHDEGTFIQLGTCYDLIYNSGVLTEDDKTLIENGAFRECARLLTATSPRGCCTNDGPYAMSCGALLGVLLGDHDTVKWAVDHAEGFRNFVRRFFFRDGHWEDGSFSYESMALGPLYACPEILQGYSDPASYTGADRYDKLDLLSEPILRLIYTAPLAVLMPNRTGPPISDSASGAQYARRHAETNYRWYPTERNRQLLAYVFDGKFGDQGDEYALFRRDPAADLGTIKPLDLSAASLVQPGVGWAILRTGAGPDAAALYLKYGVYGSGHGHPDKLNFLYYDQGAELISDQGYLGARHEFTPWNHSTLCHNEVLVDGRPQGVADGELLAFQAGGLIQTAVARGEKVYPGVSRYERSLTLVNHGPGQRYVVDVARVSGGKQHDYVIHGAGQDFAAPAGQWAPFTGEVAGVSAGAKWVRTAEAAKPTDAGLTARWSEKGKAVRFDLVAPHPATILHLTAPGLRNRNNPWEKRDLHLLMARTDGPENAFLGVVQGVSDGVKELTVAPVAAVSEVGEARAVEVRGEGFTDLLLVGDERTATGTVRCGERLRFRGQQAAVSQEASKTTLWMMNGAELEAAGYKLTSRPRLQGKIVAVDPKNYTLTVECPGLPNGTAAAGQYLLATGLADGAYEVVSIHAGAKGQQVVQVTDQALVTVQPGQAFTFNTVAEVVVSDGGRVEWHGNVPCDIALPRRTAGPDGQLLCADGNEPPRIYWRAGTGQWQPCAVQPEADRWLVRLDPARVGGNALLLIAGKDTDLTDHAAPRLLQARFGAAVTTHAEDLGYLAWTGRVALDLAETSPLTPNAIAATLTGKSGGTVPLRLGLRQKERGQWQLSLQARRDLPADDYTLRIAVTDPLGNATDLVWTFTTRGYVYSFRDLPVLASSGQVYKYLGGEYDTQFFRADAPGQHITYGFTAPRADTYEVRVTHTVSDSYGRWQFLVDGRPLGPPVEGYSATSLPVGGSPVLGTVALGAGQHRLEVRIVGKNDNSSNYFCGLVSLALKPVSERPRR